MTHALWIAAHLVWFAWLLQAVLSMSLAIKFARIVARPVRQMQRDHLPPAVVIVPFKGVEPAMADNLDALCMLDYPRYELLLVVESSDDPAVALLEQAIARHPDRPARIVVAGRADAHTGQKVHNLLAALDAAGPRPDHHALVFADSDAVPGPCWLADLVTPLVYIRHYAVTTGYRWLVPRPGPGQTRPSIWSHLASILNSSAAMFYARRAYSHAWGGSMAMLAGTAREGDLRGLWRGALSDDYQATRLAKQLGRQVYFVPTCLVASPVSLPADTFFNFARRQYIITRTHMPQLYWIALGFQALYVLGGASAWAAAVGLAFVDVGGLWHWWGPAAVIGAVLVANQIRAAFRRRVLRLRFDRRVTDPLVPTRWIDGTLTGVWSAVHLAAILTALTSRTIVWRGIGYRIDGPQSIRRLPDPEHG